MFFGHCHAYQKGQKETIGIRSQTLGMKDAMHLYQSGVEMNDLCIFFNFPFLYFFEFSCVVFLYTEKSLLSDMEKGNNFSLLLVLYFVPRCCNLEKEDCT